MCPSKSSQNPPTTIFTIVIEAHSEPISSNYISPEMPETRTFFSSRLLTLSPTKRKEDLISIIESALAVVNEAEEESGCGKISQYEAK
jgi:hypothetical protein